MIDRHLMCTSLLLMLTIGVPSQRVTIPEALASAGTSLEGGPTTPSGPPPSMDDVLNDVDWVVKGIVGDSDSYLSDDKYEVYTDYAILQPVILYPESASRLATPGPAKSMKVTLLGGTISVGPLSYTSKHQALASLDRGQTGLFLLDEVDGKLFVAAKYYGVFDLSRQKLLPMVRKPGFGEPYVGKPAAEAISSLVQRLVALRKKNAR